MRTFVSRLVIPIALAAALLLAVLTTAIGRDSEPAPVGGGSSHPDVVLLIMDEFPGDALLDRRGRVDRVRYPNFAALASDATWFRNGHSIYDATSKAVPLILDGRWPRPGTSPVRRDHPRSAFDMFARRGYRIVASEEDSALCPPSMCEGGRVRKPRVLSLLARGRPARFDSWVRTIRSGGRPTFWMKHLLLPHVPFLYLPSGAQSRPKPHDLLPGMSTVPGFHDEFLTRHNEQRFLLQLGFADRLLGRLLRRLKREGIYDDALIVVVADHGYLWRSGVETRRRAVYDTHAELGPVPFFVKRPGQVRGRVSRAYARTVDVPATIAGVLGLRLGYEDDGRSAFGRAARRAGHITFPTRDFTRVVRIPVRRWQAERRRVVRRRLRDFGSGELSSLYTGIGPNRDLIGREARSVPRATAGDTRAAVIGSSQYANVRRRSGFVPTQIAGDLRGGSASRERDLAVAVNGRIEAVGRSFHLAGDPTEHFAFMVPERSLREGPNTVQVFEVLGGDRLRAVRG